MVIVEGPDGSGKSTLVAQLAHDLSLEVQPRACSSEDGIDMATLRDWVDYDMSRPIHTSMLYDRHPLISEPIYGPILRGRMADGFNDPFWLMRRLIELDGKEPRIIYCLPPWEEVGENVERMHAATTEHMTAVLRNARALYDAYAYRAALAATSSGSSVINLWDYTTDDIDRMRAFVTARR